MVLSNLAGFENQLSLPSASKSETERHQQLWVVATAAVAALALAYLHTLEDPSAVAVVVVGVDRVQ